uniref:Sushi domain-containing protein n=1 Tax=Magallana gigas TaxID=29159 RepID=A0A8W8MM01_MAGGI
MLTDQTPFRVDNDITHEAVVTTRSNIGGNSSSRINRATSRLKVVTLVRLESKPSPTLPKHSNQSKACQQPEDLTSKSSRVDDVVSLQSSSESESEDSDSGSSDGASVISLKPGFSKLQRGHRLDRKLIQTFTEVSFLDCVTECMVTPRCKSVNYFKGANYCELNYENKTTAGTRYMDSAGWVYSEKEHWPKELAGACSNSTCEINQTCKHKRYSDEKFFECVLSDCGIPDIKGIDLGSIKREDAIGIHRRIHASCADGYSQSGSGRLNCQSNGEWKYDIVCTVDECQKDPCLNGATFYVMAEITA